MARWILMLSVITALMAMTVQMSFAGPTLREESVCDFLEGIAYGLCNAYCEVLDCHSGNPMASDNVCDEVLGSFLAKSGGELPPCENPRICGAVDWPLGLLELSCPDGYVINKIIFASYGNPIPAGLNEDTCDQELELGDCHADTSMAVVEGECLGKNNCAVLANDSIFGETCGGAQKQLYVQALCALE